MDRIARAIALLGLLAFIAFGPRLGVSHDAIWCAGAGAILLVFSIA